MVNFVSAKTIEEDLPVRKNIEVPGYNITLLVIGDDEKSIVACINNQIHIIDKNQRREIENLKVEPIRIYENYAKLKITYACEDCVCNESCSNNICLGITNNEQENETIEEDQQDIKETINSGASTTTISIILFFVVLVLLIILLVKKKR